MMLEVCFAESGTLCNKLFTKATLLGESIDPQSFMYQIFFMYHNHYMLARLQIRIAQYGTQNH